MDLRAIIGLRPKSDTADALRASLAAAEAMLEAARGRVAGLVAQRASVLLDGDEATATRHEAQLAEAQAEVSRIEVIVAALPARIQAAHEREAAEDLDRRRAVVLKRATEAAALIGAFERCAVELLTVADKIDEVQEEVAAVNRLLSAAGRSDARVPYPLAVAWPRTQTHRLLPFIELPCGLNDLRSTRQPPRTLDRYKVGLARSKSASTDEDSVAAE